MPRLLAAGSAAATFDYLRHAKEIGSSGAKLGNCNIIIKSMKILAMLALCIRNDCSRDIGNAAKDRMMQQSIHNLYLISHPCDIGNLMNLENITLIYFKLMAYISIEKDLIQASSQVILHLKNMGVTLQMKAKLTQL